jgi:hypothetical protein
VKNGTGNAVKVIAREIAEPAFYEPTTCLP